MRWHDHFYTVEGRPVRSSHLKSWNFTQNLHQAILVVSTLLGSWLGMQAAHEAGHVSGPFSAAARSRPSSSTH